MFENVRIMFECVYIYTLYVKVQDIMPISILLCKINTFLVMLRKPADRLG